MRVTYARGSAFGLTATAYECQSGAPFPSGVPCAKGWKHGLRAAASGAASGTASGAAGLTRRGLGPLGAGPLREQKRVPWGTPGSKIQAWGGAGQE